MDRLDESRRTSGYIKSSCTLFGNMTRPKDSTTSHLGLDASDIHCVLTLISSDMQWCDSIWAQEGKLPNDLLVGLAEKGEVLARRLDARRHYVQNNLAYDPHFLVFECLGDAEVGIYIDLLYNLYNINIWYCMFYNILQQYMYLSYVYIYIYIHIHTYTYTSTDTYTYTR